MESRKGITGIALVLSILALTAIDIFAQTVGSISGYVTDMKSGEPLIGVNVYFEGTGFGASTDLNGYYQVENVPTGTYNLIAEYVGYKAATKFNTSVKSGGNPDINFQLQSVAIETDEVVTTQGLFEKPEDNPVSIRELSQVEIATYPGGNNDIARVIQSLPGVTASPLGFRNDVIIRGGAPNENVYYLDGIEIPNINHFATQGSAGGPVGLLNVSFFEGVTLSASSFPAKYDNVLSSVLQFTQRNGNAERHQYNFRLGFSEAAATVEGPLFKGKDEAYSNTTYMLSLRRSYLQFLFKVVGLPFLPDYWDYQYKVSHKSSNYDEISLIGLGSIDDFRINVPDDIDEEQQAVLDQVPVIKQWTTTHGIAWTHRFRDFKSKVRTALSMNYFDNNFRRYRDNENLSGLFLDNNSTERDIKLRSEYNRFDDRWSISSGILLQHTLYKNATEDLVNNNQFDTDLSYYRYGIFAQASGNWLADRLNATVGLRTDGNTFSTDGNNLAETISPRLGLAYVINQAKRLAVNASIGRYYKLPPNTILGFRDNTLALPNKGASYIRSDHLVAGISLDPSRTTQISLEAFYKRYDNYPVSLRDSVSLANLGADFAVFGNEAIESVGLGRTYGLEFTYQRKLSNNFYGLLAYTLYRSEFTGFDRDEFLPSLWDNRQLVSFTGGYKIGNSLEIGARLRYAGKAPFAALDREATLEEYPALIFDYSSLGEQRLAALNSLDIRIDKKWNFRTWTLDAYLEVQNITGSELPSAPTYGLRRDEAGNVQQPRELVEIEPSSSGQVLPTIGIVIDF